MSQSGTILLAGGGTGGHLYPGIAVAEALVREHPQIEPLFLCTNRPIDRAILESTPFQFIPQPIVPPGRTVGGLLRFWRAWRETKDLIHRVLRERDPRAILGLGGYAAGAAVKMAAQRDVPAAILNPDVIPGRANRFLMSRVQAVCCQFEATRQHVASAQRSKLQITGCPIRETVRHLPAREESAKRLGLEARLNTLLITGASQGALTVNDAVLETLPALSLQGWQILHLSGIEHAEKVRTEYRGRQIAATVIDFTPAMSDIWAVADLAVCRAGASTCAELTACGVPSVLMPYPYHKDMHQRANAKVLADAGAAVLVDDSRDRKDNAARLKPVLESLLYDGDRRAEMSTAARNMGQPDAAEAIVRVVTQMLSANR